MQLRWGFGCQWFNGLLCFALVAPLLNASGVGQSNLKAGQPKPDAAGDWPMVGKSLDGQRYSALTQITPGNVNTLKVAWVYHMRPEAAAATAAGASSATPARFRQSEDQPLVIGTTMYVATPYGRVVALDSATGTEKWTFEIPGGDNASLRGASYWPGEGPHGPAIIFGTRRGHLYSISAATGKLNPGFGENGMVDLKTPEVMTTGMDKSYILPSPPIIYKNLIITGSGPGEGPGGLNGGLGPAGDTRAWDAITGKLIWTFHSVPRPGETGHETWTGDSWKNRSGVNVWGYMTIDAQRGILYMPFGAPNNDRVGVDRPGNNLFGSSVVAVKVETGKLLWYFQVVHHDIWDMDTQSPPMLFDIKHGKKIIPALATVNKNGLMFILDRVTGKPVYGVEERPVPKSDVPGEEVSPTQPYPVLPEPLSQISLSRDHLYNDTPEHKLWCERFVDDNNIQLNDVPYTPTPLNRYSIKMPGTQGGVNYYGGAFDPTLGLFIANVNNLGQPMRIVKNPDGSYSNAGPLAGLNRFWDPSNHLPCGPTPWGQLVAVDVNTGKIAWRSTLGVTDSLPEGKQNTGRPGLGGAILTASGLAFIGATDDARFRAFDTKTGKEIWTVKLPASAESTPITYADANGRQYVAVVATGGGLIGAALASDSLVVYSLPNGNDKASVSEARADQPAHAVSSVAAPSSATPAKAASPSNAVHASIFPALAGRETMLRVCSNCHSPNVVADQRHDAQGWNDVIQMMVTRGAVASDADLDTIVGYLTKAFPKEGTSAAPARP